MAVSRSIKVGLKRTGTGDPYLKKMYPVMTCTDPSYFFRWVPVYDMIMDETPIAIEVVGGVGPYNWSVAETGFSLGSASTEGRTNTIGLVYPVAKGDVGIISVTDSCDVTVTGRVVSWHDVTLPPYQDYDTFVEVADADYGAPLTLIGVDQIGSTVYITHFTASGYGLLSWDGSGSTLTEVVVPSVSLASHGTPPKTIVAKDTKLYVATAPNYPLLRWESGNSWETVIESFSGYHLECFGPNDELVTSGMGPELWQLGPADTLALLGTADRNLDTFRLYTYNTNTLFIGSNDTTWQLFKYTGAGGVETEAHLTGRAYWIISRGSYLYASDIGASGPLYQLVLGEDRFTTICYTNRQLTNIINHGEHIFGIAYIGRLYKYNDVDAWDRVTDNDLGNGRGLLFIYGDRLHVVHASGKIVRWGA